MFQTVFGGRQYPSEVCESWTCKIRTTCHERREYYWQSNLIAAWLFKRMCIFPASEWFILGDPGTVSRAGRNGATNVFKHGRKSPWVPTLIGTFPNGQANTGSWLGTKKMLCIIVLNRRTASPEFFLWVRTYGYWLDHGLSGSCTKEMHAVRKLSVWYKLSISKYCLSEN